MKKFLCCFLITIFYSAVCLAIPPQPADKSSFSPTVPEGSIPPNPTYIASNITKPYPTNKWFNSIIYNQHNYFSVNMYTYPQVFRAQTDGLLIEYPKVISSDNRIGFKDDMYETLPGTDSKANTILVSVSTSTSISSKINFDCAKLDGYSDFSARIKWEQDDKWMTSTITQGSPFSYYEFSNNVYPAIDFPYEWGGYWYYDTRYIPSYVLYNVKTGDEIGINDLEYSDDAILLHIHLEATKKDVYYGIFAPSGAKFVQDSTCRYNNPWIRIAVNFTGADKYLSVALLPSKNLEEAKEDVKVYYKYAYNFITDTKVNWKVNSDYSSQTDFSITTTKKRTDIEDQQEGTLFCLFPHQYDNLVSQTNILNDKTFDTLRGTLKLASGNNFSTKTKFYGIVPFFQYDTKEIKSDLETYLTEDNDGIDVPSVSPNPYYAGKIIAKLANMLPVADNINNSILKDSLKIKLKALLEDWFTYSDGEQSKYFAYDIIWGGLFGVKDDKFGSHLYNDHHFHFGYFIYSAAILAMYDDSFIKDYGQMVNLLIKDFANTDRTDENFPYMRNYDFYESHSWANGMGGMDNGGIDQESSSEAMNAWVAVYLWGLITQNKEIENLGIYLYSNEYQAIKYYYFDIYENILKGDYKHNSVGILRGGSLEYNVLFDSTHATRQIKGIQLLPMTPAMAYLAYDKEYARNFYLQMESETPNDYYWNDIWTRFRALFEPQSALTSFIDNPEVDDGGSKSFTYHFINFFNKYGTPNFTYTADVPSYMVLEKNNIPTYCAYNPGNSSKNIHFYDSLGKDLGYLIVGAKSFSSSSNLIKGGENKKISVYPVPYKPQSGGKYDAEGITFLGVTNGDNIKIFNVAGEKVFEETVSITGNLFVWNGENNAGKEVASGIYFYYIKTTDGRKFKGKLAIER